MINVFTAIAIFSSFLSASTNLNYQKVKNENSVILKKKTRNNILAPQPQLNIEKKETNDISMPTLVVPQIRNNYIPSVFQNTAPRNREWCGTMPQWELNNPELRGCNLYGVVDNPNIRDTYIPTVDDDIIYIRLFIHAFADNNGNNPTANLDDVEAQIFTLNEAFINQKIQFIAWFQIHNSTQHLLLSSEDWSSGNIKENFNADPLTYHNIYVTDTDEDFSILGVSTFPWDSDALTIYGGTLIDKDWFGGPRFFNNSNDVPQNTIVHELGHAFGLWHTHHGVDEVEECGACYEGADGYVFLENDNEDVVGDLCSDTKGTVTNFSCSDPEGEDCQGNSWNNTNFHNYMGYADDDCYNINNQGFTSQQSGRLRGWITEKYSGLTVNEDSNLLLSTSFEEYSFPSGWDVYDLDNDNNTWGIFGDSNNPGFDIANFGDAGVILYTGYGANDWLVTPLIDIPTNASNCTFSFWANSHHPQYLEDFSVRISTDGIGIVGQSTFNSLDLVYDTPNGWTNYTYDLSGYLGQSVHIAIQALSSSGFYLFIDDFEVSVDYQDLPVSADFSADFTSGSSPLDVAFTDLSSGSPEQWLWSFGDGNTSQEQNPSHLYVNPGVYTVSLEVSKGSETDTAVKTGYIVVSNILSEDFSQGIPTDWDIVNVNNDNITWQLYSESNFGADIAYSNDNSVGIYYTSSGNNDWLITSPLVLPENNNIIFSFWARSYDPSWKEDFNVLISNSSNGPLEDFQIISSITDASENWTEYSYDISSYSGDIIEIAIQSVSVDKWYLFLDDFYIENSVINQRPVVQNIEFSIDEDTEYSSFLLGNDTDVNDVLTYFIVAQPSRGLLSQPNEYGNEFLYIPDTNFFGEDLFSYVAYDGNIYSDTALVSIIIHPINDAPVVESDSTIILAEDGSADFIMQGFDIDDDYLEYEIVRYPIQGNYNGSTYTPYPDYFGYDTLSYVAIDTSSAESELATVSFMIESVDDEPFINNYIDQVMLMEDFLEPLNFNLDTVFTDIDGPLTYSAELIDSNVVSVEVVENILSFYAIPNANGVTELILTASNPTRASVADTMMISVDAINDPPSILVGDTSMFEDGHLAIKIHAIDVDGDSLDYIDVHFEPDVVDGYFFGGDSLMIHSIVEDWNGTVSVHLEVTDGYLVEYAQFTLAVLPVNDAPYFINQMHATVGVGVEFHLMLQPFDVDYETPTVSLTEGTENPSWIMLEVDELNRHIFHGTPDSLGEFPVYLSLIDGEITVLDTFNFRVVHFKPEITSIEDIPNDQGGEVYVRFNRSFLDNGLETNQLYGIYRWDNIEGEDGWVLVQSGPAIGTEFYYFQVPTLHDSSIHGDGMTQFKVVASMNNGIFSSNQAMGYSVDNIVPNVPTGMLAASMDNYIFLSWDVSPDEDFQYFELLRTGVSADDIVVELVETMYEDHNIEAGVEYSYKLAAYDYNGNFSGYSEPILISMLRAKDNGLIPDAYALNQNYPNPFNPTTQINYELPKNNYISLIIYDVKGQEVKSLVNSTQEAGYKTVLWDATNNLGKQVPAGMYIYTIQAGDFRQTRKMVLLK